MKYQIRLLTCLFGLLSHVSISQNYKPEDTEVWDPVKVVKSGNGTEAPSDAIILFDGKDMSNWDIPAGSEWVVKDGIVTITPSRNQVFKPIVIASKQLFGDIQLHVEWKTPEEIKGEGQRRGNSGIWLPGRYELQVLDSYENKTYSNGQAGSIYKQVVPLANASRKPGEWQTYDIVYRAPRFLADGKLQSPAYVTVIHNGVLIQDHAEIKGTTTFLGPAKYVPHPLKQTIGLQDHGNAVSYRNIWLREL